MHNSHHLFDLLRWFFATFAVCVCVCLPMPFCAHDSFIIIRSSLYHFGTIAPPPPALPPLFRSTFSSSGSCVQAENNVAGLSAAANEILILMISCEWTFSSYRRTGEIIRKLFYEIQKVYVPGIHLSPSISFSPDLSLLIFSSSAKRFNAAAAAAAWLLFRLHLHSNVHYRIQ